MYNQYNIGLNDESNDKSRYEHTLGDCVSEGFRKVLTREGLWPSITALDGRELKTLERGRPFEVRDVRQDRVVVTPAVSGARRTIQRGVLEGAFNALLDRRELTGVEIAGEFSAFNAVYIAALLAALPDVAACTRPTRLIFVGHQLFYLE